MTALLNVRRLVASQLWAIQPEFAEAMLEVLQLRLEGRLAPEEISARLAAADHGALGASANSKPVAPSSGDIAVIPLRGIIAQRASMVNSLSGPQGTSVEAFLQAFDDAMADPAVSAIVIDCDSPGGTINGVPEAAAHIADARGTKRIIAVASGQMASAAYWLCSAADEIAASPSAEVGSVGVYTVHDDLSGMLGAEGVKQTVIKAGKYKAETHPSQPLSDEARAALQDRVDEAHGMMTSAIGKHRGVSAADVRANYGEGRVLSAKKALDAKMIDRIATLGDVVGRLKSSRGGPKPGSGRRAEHLKQTLAFQTTKLLGATHAAAAPAPAVPVTRQADGGTNDA